MLFTTKCENIERDVMNKAMSPFVFYGDWYLRK
jgi:hypothetical protein